MPVAGALLDKLDSFECRKYKRNHRAQIKSSVKAIVNGEGRKEVRLFRGHGHRGRRLRYFDGDLPHIVNHLCTPGVIFVP